MCGYVLFLQRCGFYLSLKADTICDAIMAQLHRINSAEAWTASGKSTLPFTVPTNCDPSCENSKIANVDRTCGPQEDRPSLKGGLVLPKEADGVTGL